MLKVHANTWREGDELRRTYIIYCEKKSSSNKQSDYYLRELAFEAKKSPADEGRPAKDNT